MELSFRAWKDFGNHLVWPFCLREGKRGSDWLSDLPTYQGRKPLLPHLAFFLVHHPDAFVLVVLLMPAKLEWSREANKRPNVKSSWIVLVGKDLRSPLGPEKVG